MNRNIFILTTAFLALSSFVLSANGQSPQSRVDVAFRASGLDAANASRQIDDQQVDQWITDLGSSRFKTRESAEAKLRGAGPTALRALMAAAVSDDSEIAWRATSLLRTLSLEIDPQKVQPLVEELHALGQNDRPDLARIGSELVARWKAERSRQAVQRLSSLGARFQTAQTFETNQLKQAVNGRPVENANEQAAESESFQPFEEAEHRRHEIARQLAELKEQVEADRLPYLGSDDDAVATELRKSIEQGMTSNQENGPFDLSLPSLEGQRDEQAAGPQNLAVDGARLAEMFEAFEADRDFEMELVEDDAEIGGALIDGDGIVIGGGRMIVIEEPIIVEGGFGGFGGGFGGGGMGGAFGGPVFIDGDFANNGRFVISTYVTIPASFRGTAKDLRLLQAVENIGVIEFTAFDMTTDTLVELAALDKLKTLTISNSNFDTEWLKAFTRLRPDVTLTLSGAAYLGINAQLNDDDVVGCRVTNVIADSAAGKAGLQLNDIIVRIDDQPITSFTDLTVSIANRKIGEQVEIEVSRDGSKRVFFAKLGDRSKVSP